MKAALHFNRYIKCLSVFLLVILYSCDKKDKISTPQMIMITGIDSATYKCIMKDVNGNAADTIQVSAGEKIQWIIQTNVVKDIKDIYKKTASQNIFSEEPHRVGNTSTWEGTISASASGQEEDYNIDWTDQADMRFTYDPKIQVK